MANKAAFLTAAKARPFEIKEVPAYKPEKNEILIQNHAIAINPIDGGLQTHAWFPLNYPTILGADVAGTVIEVGADVTRFKKGDRVLGQAVGVSTKRLSDNGFQSHTTLLEHMASPIPAGISFEAAAVVPLGLSTAACGLFQQAPFLNLRLPTEPAHPQTGEVVLVWGGASSVGSNAIQAARAAGYAVITTASPRNFEYVRRLGAEQVLDYNGPSVAEDLLSAVRGREIAGTLDCIGGRALEVLVDVVSRAGAGKGAIATTKGGVEDPPEGVSIQRIFGTSLKDNAVGPAVYADYLPKALAAGRFVPSPAPEVVGRGLERVQEAVDALMKGVSAKKLVVSL